MPLDSSSVAVPISGAGGLPKAPRAGAGELTAERGLAASRLCACSCAMNEIYGMRAGETWACQGAAKVGALQLKP